MNLHGTTLRIEVRPVVKRVVYERGEGRGEGNADVFRPVQCVYVEIGRWTTVDNGGFPSREQRPLLQLGLAPAAPAMCAASHFSE